MFFKRTQESNEYDGSNPESEDSISKLYGLKKITLATTAIESSFIGFGSSQYTSDLKKHSASQDIELTGVLHEPFPVEKFIPFKISITGYHSIHEEPEKLGWCCLTEVSQAPNKKCRDIMLEGSIWDADQEIQKAVLSTMRDAAISDNQFCQFCLILDKSDAIEAKNKFEKEGYGPSVKIRGIQMWPTISLPKMPSWAKVGDY